MPGWPLMLTAFALSAGIGLVQDLAPQWSGLAFLVGGGLAVVVGLGSRTRHGAVLFGRRVQPRSHAHGSGPTSRSRGLLVYAGAAMVSALIMAVGVGLRADSGPADTWWPDGFPNTVLWLGSWAVATVILLAYSGWLQRRPAKS